MADQLDLNVLKNALSHYPEGDFASRCQGIVPYGQGQAIEIASDGLDLAAKIRLESYLFAKVAGLEGWSINFRRQEKSQLPEPGAQRTVHAPHRSALGAVMRRKPIAGVAKVLLVASGKGGVGKSTVAANLAVGLASHGLRVGLLDADIYGPSSPTMLGLKGPMAIDDASKIVPLSAYGVRCVSFGFLTDALTPVIWRGPLVSKAIEQLCYEVHWDPCDVLIVDLPPGTGDVQMTLIETLPIHSAIIVSTPQDVALIDAHKALSMFQQLDVPVLGIVGNMVTYSCRKCGHVEHIFGHQLEEFCLLRGTKQLAEIPLEMQVRVSADLGQPAVLIDGPGGNAFRDLTAEVLTLLTAYD